MPRSAPLALLAAFLASFALAACKRDPPAPVQPPPAASVAVEAKPSAAPARPPAAVKPPPNRPTLDAKVSTDGEAKRARAAARIEKLQGPIEELASVIPVGCTATEPVCRKRFEVFAVELAKLRADLAQAAVPLCVKGVKGVTGVKGVKGPKDGADEVAVEQMAHAQVAWLSLWVDDIEAAGKAGFVDSGGVWSELRASGEKAHPRVAPTCAP